MHRKTRKKRAKSRQNMAILGIKTWKMENIAENDRKEGIRTRQGFGELILSPIPETSQVWACAHLPIVILFILKISFRNYCMEHFFASI